jgi:hypothetical protein
MKQFGILCTWAHFVSNQLRFNSLYLSKEHFNTNTAIWIRGIWSNQSFKWTKFSNRLEVKFQWFFNLKIPQHFSCSIISKSRFLETNPYGTKQEKTKNSVEMWNFIHNLFPYKFGKLRKRRNLCQNIPVLLFGIENVWISPKKRKKQCWIHR